MTYCTSFRSVLVCRQDHNGVWEPSGSGVEFLPGKIMTARHVIEMNGDFVESLKVGWWMGADTDTDLFYSEEISTDGILWSSANCDVAIISVEGRPPSEDFKFGSLSFSSDSKTPPQDLYGWGFPFIADQDQKPQLYGVSGKGHLDSQSGIYQVNNFTTIPEGVRVDKKDVAKANEGVSGAGLFADSHLAAIVKTAQNEPATLRAVSLDHVRKKYPSFDEVLNKLFLKQSTSLDDQLNTLLDNVYLERIEEGQNTNIRDLAFRCDPESIIKCLSLIRGILYTAKEFDHHLIGWCHELARTVVSRFFLTIPNLPRVDDEYSSVSLLSSMLTVAEFIMAAHDERVVAFQSPGSLDSPGRFRANSPPPSAFSIQYEEDVFMEIRRLIGAKDDKILDGTIGNSESVLERDFEESRHIVLGALKIRKVDKLPSFYITVRSRDYGKEEELNKVIEKVRNWFGGFVPVVVLTGKDQFWLGLNELAHALQSTLSVPSNMGQGHAQ